MGFAVRLSEKQARKIIREEIARKNKKILWEAKVGWIPDPDSEEFESVIKDAQAVLQDQGGMPGSVDGKLESFASQYKNFLVNNYQKNVVDPVSKDGGLQPVVSMLPSARDLFENTDKSLGILGYPANYPGWAGFISAGGLPNGIKKPDLLGRWNTATIEIIVDDKKKLDDMCNDISTRAEKIVSYSAGLKADAKFVEDKLDGFTTDGDFLEIAQKLEKIIANDFDGLPRTRLFLGIYAAERTGAWGEIGKIIGTGFTVATIAAIAIPVGAVILGTTGMTGGAALPAWTALGAAVASAGGRGAVRSLGTRAGAKKAAEMTVGKSYRALTTKPVYGIGTGNVGAAARGGTLAAAGGAGLYAGAGAAAGIDAFIKAAVYCKQEQAAEYLYLMLDADRQKELANDIEAQYDVAKFPTNLTRTPAEEAKASATKAAVLKVLAAITDDGIQSYARAYTIFSQAAGGAWDNIHTSGVEPAELYDRERERELSEQTLYSLRKSIKQIIIEVADLGSWDDVPMTPGEEEQPADKVASEKVPAKDAEKEAIPPEDYSKYTLDELKASQANLQRYIKEESDPDKKATFQKQLSDVVGFIEAKSSGTSAAPAAADAAGAAPAGEKKYARDWDQYVKLAGDTESATRIRELWVDLNHRPNGVGPGFWEWVRFYNQQRDMKYPGTDRHIYSADFIKILEELKPQKDEKIAASELPTEKPEAAAELPTEEPEAGAAEDIVTGRTRTVVRNQGRTHVYKAPGDLGPEFNIRDLRRGQGEDVRRARAIRIQSDDGEKYRVRPGMRWNNKIVSLRLGRGPLYTKITASDNGKATLDAIHKWIEDNADKLEVR